MARNGKWSSGHLIGMATLCITTFFAFTSWVFILQNKIAEVNIKAGENIWGLKYSLGRVETRQESLQQTLQALIDRVEEGEKIQLQIYARDLSFIRAMFPENQYEYKGVPEPSKSAYGALSIDLYGHEYNKGEKIQIAVIKKSTPQAKPLNSLIEINQLPHIPLD